MASVYSGIVGILAFPLFQPLPATPERRRLVIIDVKLIRPPRWNRYAPIPKDAIKQFAITQEAMMAKLVEMMDTMDLHSTTQLYQLTHPMADELIQAFQATGMHAIIAQNYTSRKQLVHESHYCLGYRDVGARDLKIRWPATRGQQPITPF
ncbi:unnamed protein product, partial [Mesorhabditis spiculigera]